jgi:hypothetical protein
MKLFPYNESVELQLHEIKKALHVRMNGEVADNLKAKGYDYKLNYGTLLSEIKELSKRFVPNQLLAERLWNLRIRETMMLATYLYPIDKFSSKTADEWAENILQKEIAEILCLNLLSKLDNAELKVFEWIKSASQNKQLLAFLLLARVYKKIEDEKLFEYIQISIQTFETSEDTSLLESITLALKKIGTKNEIIANKLFLLLSKKEIESSKKRFLDEIILELNFYLNQ